MYAASVHQTKGNHNYFLIVFLMLIGVFVIMEMSILSNIGTKGEELSIIKNSQNVLKEENEILKARVLALKSNNSVLQGLEQKADIQIKPINVLNPDLLDISAQQ